MEAHLWYGLAWLSFGVLHSLLASDGVKTRLKGVFGSAYRLFYNLLSVAHFGAILYLGFLLFGTADPFFGTAAQNAMIGLAVAGWLFAIWAIQAYSFWRLAGLAQIWRRIKGMAPLPEYDPVLLTSGLHRHMRHPIYLGMLLILWGQAFDERGLVTALWGTAYLAVGTVFEERKLVRVYGDAYRIYRARVPAVLPWKLFSSSEAGANRSA